MGRAIALIFGVISYFVFFLTFLYLIGFLANFLVPKGIDDGVATSFGLAAAINIGLIVLFGLQHSAMARPDFKAWWTRTIPTSIERSTYVLLSSLVLILMFWQWRPMTQVVWQVDTQWLAYPLWGLYLAGILLVLLSTFIIDHFDLFGLRQVWMNLKQTPYTEKPFSVRLFYRFVRHPLYVGWFLTFWATPAMSLGHLIFAIGMSAYIVIAVPYEERDLVRYLGSDYESYRERVPKFIPRVGKAHEPVKGRPGTAAQH
jgi:protein-S-isoprenylcysteine O-methyltransferase Ste14